MRDELKIEYCPECKAKLSNEPRGNKVFVCAKHGEIIVSAIWVSKDEN